MWTLIAATWILNLIEATAQQTKTPAFEHVHSLTMDADGRSLLVGAHTGLFRSEDGDVIGRKLRFRKKTPNWT